MLKQQILNHLKKNMNKFVSGEQLSVKLNVSRTAIWKNIKSLQSEGYIIDSSTKKGYCLLSVPDILNSFEITENLETKFIGRNVFYFPAIDSTNNYAKKIALDTEGEGTAVVAGEQTDGRGRLGHQWSSSGEKGIWMSIILKPDISPEKIQIITIMTAVVIVKAIKKLYGIDLGIKWPNDLILDNKKVCGILTEMNCETERVNYIVVGIGINVSLKTTDFPQDLKDIATSLLIHSEERMSKNGDKKKNDDKTNNVEKSEIKFNRSEIIKCIFVEFEKLYNKVINNDTADIIDMWRKFSVTLGREVRVSSRDSDFTGIAKDIKEDGKLLVDCGDGVVKEVSSGEVSVKNLMGYI